MAKRVCIEHGCPIVSDHTRCPEHARQRDKARGTSTQRGYDYQHQRLRAAWAPRVQAGTVQCWRCGDPLDPAAWTLGHCDNDRTRYHGPECPPCDYATAGRTDCPHPSHH